MKTFQTSFFDESKRLAALSRLRDPLEELAKHIDFGMFRPILTDALRTPWLPETEKMINGPLLRSMPQGATLINTSRGAVIDEADLCEMLANRSDITAILDVTHPEPPLPDSPLRTLENVVLTPHIAGSIGGEIARMGYWMKDELDLYLAHKPLQHGVTQDMLARMA